MAWGHKSLFFFLVSFFPPTFLFFSFSLLPLSPLNGRTWGLKIMGGISFLAHIIKSDALVHTGSHVLPGIFLDKLRGRADKKTYSNQEFPSVDRSMKIPRWVGPYCKFGILIIHILNPRVNGPM